MARIRLGPTEEQKWASVARGLTLEKLATDKEDTLHKCGALSVVYVI